MLDAYASVSVSLGTLYWRQSLWLLAATRIYSLASLENTRHRHGGGGKRRNGHGSRLARLAEVTSAGMHKKHQKRHVKNLKKATAKESTPTEKLQRYSDRENNRRCVILQLLPSTFRYFLTLEYPRVHLYFFFLERHPRGYNIPCIE